MCVAVPLQNLGCARYQEGILWPVVAACESLSDSVWEVAEKHRLFIEHGVWGFFQRNTCPSPLIVKAVSLWYFVFLSRICVCFPCTDGLKLKRSRFIGYLQSHMCWALGACEVYFKAVLNSRARAGRKACRCWPETPELQTVGLHTSGTSNGFAYT